MKHLKTRKNKKISKILFFSIILFSFTALPVLAGDFDPNFVIADDDLLAKDAMTQVEIQNFLAAKNGTLDDYICSTSGKDQNGNDIAPNQLDTAQAIYEVAQRWGISPKFLLVLMQREQSLVEDPAPAPKQFDWATGYGVCDSCSLSDPALQRWKGFYQQLNSAAAQFQYYLQNPAEFYYQKGKTYTIDGARVTPGSVATAAIYNYTPHLNGNKNFYNIWIKWFSRVYPDGSLVQAKDDPAVWYLQYGTRRPIKSKLALLTRFNSKSIISISQADLESYPVGWPISLANYSLVRSPQKRIYLIVDDVKRPIMSQVAFKKIGWNPEEVTDVTEADLQNFMEGDPITENSVYPDGVLAQNKTTGGIYFVKDGQKYPIFSKEIMQVNFPGKKLIRLLPAELDAYTTGDPVKFKDGALIKPKEFGEVYVVSNGQRRWIPDEKTFYSLGYKMANVITAPYQAVALLPIGEILIDK